MSSAAAWRFSHFFARAITCLLLMSCDLTGVMERGQVCKQEEHRLVLSQPSNKEPLFTSTALG